MREAVEEAVMRVGEPPRGSVAKDRRAGPRREAAHKERVATFWGRAGVVALVGSLSVAGGWLVYRSEAGAEGSERTQDFRTYEELPLCADAPRIWNQTIRQGPRETLRSAIADVDGDGRKDLLFVNQQAETVTLWRAATGGIAGEPLEIPASRSEEAPLVMDLDEDGHQDLILALKDDAAIGILRGRGNGTFAPLEKTFQAPPPQAMFLFPGTRTMLFGNTAGQLAMRTLAPRVEDWGTSRQVLAVDGWEPVAFLRESAERVLALGGQPLSAMRVDAQGRALETRVLPAWSGTALFTADLIEPRGNDELYSVSSIKQVLRHDLSDGRPVCRFGPRVPADSPSVSLGDLDGDGVVDAVGARTCAGCTSNHVVWMGGR
jgi:hypothetical protein